MPLMPQFTTRILAVGLALPVFAGMLAGCGQKGPLYIPSTPPAAQRATLPQTVFGQPTRPASAPAVPASAPQTPPPPSALPNLPETQ